MAAVGVIVAVTWFRFPVVLALAAAFPGVSEPVRSATEPVGVTEQTVEVSSDSRDIPPGHPTWEEAAVAQALRTNPGLRYVSVDRVRFRGVGPRVRVGAEGGYCHIFGGMAVRDENHEEWWANDIGEC